MANTILLKEPPERVGPPEFPFPSREAYYDWLKRRAISGAWYASQEAERRLTEKYGPGPIRLEGNQGIMAHTVLLKEPPEPVGPPEFPFPSREAFYEWIRRRAISNAWYAAQELERRLTEKYGPGPIRPEEDHSTDE